MAKTKSPSQTYRWSPKLAYAVGLITTEGDLHKPLSETDRNNLVSIFSIQSTRRINNDFTIQFKNNWYQLAEIQPTTVRPKEVVTVEERLDGTIHFSLQKLYLNYTVLPEKPKKKQIRQPVILTTHHLNWKPPQDHPWRKFKLGGGDISILK